MEITERTRCKNCIYFSDITLRKWGTGECFVRGWNQDGLPVGPASFCTRFHIRWELIDPAFKGQKGVENDKL
jgi:hypothetical protein